MKESKEKAKELVNKFLELTGEEFTGINISSKQCALICIDKQLELLRYLGKKTPEELYQDLIKQKVALK